MPPRVCAHEEVIKIVLGALGEQQYHEVRGAYEQHRGTQGAPARGGTVQQLRAAEVVAVCARVKNAAAASVEREFRTVRTLRLGVLQGTVAAVRQGSLATEKAALDAIDAECKAVGELREASRRRAAADAEKCYALKAVVYSGHTLRVVQELLHIDENMRWRVDDVFIMQKLPRDHAGVLHELLVGALLVHEARLLAGGGECALGDEDWQKTVDDTRAWVVTHFVQQDRKNALPARIRALEADVAHARGVLQERMRAIAAHGDLHE